MSSLGSLTTGNPANFLSGCGSPTAVRPRSREKTGKHLCGKFPEIGQMDSRTPLTSRRAAMLGLITFLLGGATGCRTSLRQWVRNGFKVGPNYARPTAEVAEDWLDSAAPQLASHRSNDPAWWAVFGDPVLNQLIEEASTQNLPLQAAAERIWEARAQLGAARGTLWPQKQQMIGQFQRSKFSDNAYPWGSFPIPKLAFDQWTLGFDAAWELDFWGRIRRAIEAAEANVEIQDAAYDELLVLLQAEVALNYIQVRTIDERLSLARKNVELLRKTLQIAQARFEGGLVSRLDVLQAEAILANTEAMIPMMEAARRRAENRLCTLLGATPQDLDGILGEGPTPAPPAEVVVGIPADLLRRRPDVRRAERAVAAQCAKIGIAESELYPRFAITGTIAVESEHFRHLFDSKSQAGRIGPGFSWNILNYGRIRNNILAEESKFRQTVLMYQETVLRANEEVEGAITAYLRELERVSSLETAVGAAEQAVQIAIAQYEQGVIDFQRLIDSQRALVQQQDALAESRGDVAGHLVAIYKALGGGWEVRYLDGPRASGLLAHAGDSSTGSLPDLPIAMRPEELTGNRR